MALTNKVLNKDDNPFDEIIFHCYENQEQCNDNNCKSISKLPILGSWVLHLLKT